ncbi:MAG: ribbon-helix-helix domain-containing protein [Micrococcales bacterium]|nr:ribbon-helix-helix domain-containing protein [Micrococcales bacterium]
MSLTAEEQARYARMAAAAEAADRLPEGARVVAGVGEEPGRDFLAQFMTPAELDEVSRRSRGRPRLTEGTGRSPGRHVRLTDDLDAALVARAKAEGRPMSALVRDAVAAYLATPSTAA